MNCQTSSQTSGRVAGNVSGDSTSDLWRKREALRRRYRPTQVKVLFIGEAPPASGRFFYQGDSGLYRAVRDTFYAAFQPFPEDPFLEEFRTLGCYLVDLCGEPVDHLPYGARMRIRCAGEPRLARAVRLLRPAVVVTLLRSIRANVEWALKKANWSGMRVEPPYPGRWKRHRVEFERQLVPVLRATLCLPSDKGGI